MIESYVRKPRWRDPELTYLETHYSPDMSLEEAANDLGRSPNAVRLMLSRTKIKPPSGIQKFPWSDIEKQRVKDLLPHMTVQDISYLLNRSYDSVRNKVRHMKLTVVHYERKLGKMEGITPMKKAMYHTLINTGFSHEAIVNSLRIQHVPHTAFTI